MMARDLTRYPITPPKRVVPDCYAPPRADSRYTIQLDDHATGHFMKSITYPNAGRRAGVKRFIRELGMTGLVLYNSVSTTEWADYGFTCHDQPDSQTFKMTFVERRGNWVFNRATCERSIYVEVESGAKDLAQLVEYEFVPRVDSLQPTLPLYHDYNPHFNFDPRFNTIIYRADLTFEWDPSDLIGQGEYLFPAASSMGGDTKTSANDSGQYDEDDKKERQVAREYHLTNAHFYVTQCPL